MNLGGMMKKITGLILIFISISINLLSQERRFVSYYELTDFMQASPGAFKYGLYGFSNPASTTYLNGNDILFVYSDKIKNINNGNRWGIFLGNPQNNILSINIPSTGYGLLVESDSNKSVYDFRYSLGFGDRVYNFGMGIGYSFGDVDYFNRSGIIFLGGIYRPLPQLSIGLQRTFAFEGGDGETVAEIGIRPFGTYPLTFYTDASIFDGQIIKNSHWSAGISWEIIDGLRINGRYFDNKAINLGLDISFGEIGFASQSNFNSNKEYDYNSYFVRIGALDRTFLDYLESGNKYITLDLKGDLQYLGFLWFDKSNKLLDILQLIDKATKDSDIKGLVINTSGLNANMELLWEIREKLKHFKNSGKKVIIFTDRLSMPQYHFASIADKLILDPLGTISLSGYAVGKSYYKTMIEKLGIGFQDLRFFKYKSAYESFERDSMSEGDYEQLKKLIDDWYEFTRKEICETRKITENNFDEIVNSYINITSRKALELNLVDTLARWNDLEEVIKNFDQKINLEKISNIRRNIIPEDDHWGQPPKSIAIVYALGVCDMDNGIKARELSNYLNQLVKSDVGAIILRVDSPGGDALASDLVADIIRKNKGKKPIIVSHGAVAASGGYWLSMDADTIVSSPMTITGSIGVIGGWFYNKGLADSMGIHTDIIKRGKYADLGFPFTLPLIPIGLPNRPMTEEERNQIANYIKDYYKDFVDKVADGRDMDFNSVDNIAQGRIWTGLSAKNNGLVDELGGLWKAIEIAKNMAGYDQNDDVRIIQYPKSELFDISKLLSATFGLELKEVKNEVTLLKFLIENNGLAMPILPIDFLEFVQDK